MRQGTEAAAQETELSRRRLAQLRWLTTVAPALVVFLYDTARHNLLDGRWELDAGNLAVGLLALTLAYGFSAFVFGIVERSQARAVARSREVATLSAVIQERERLSRELHDGLAQLVAYLLVRVDTVTGLLAADRRGEAIAELERLREVADGLYVDIRESISDLRTRVSERGLAHALGDYLDEFEERHGVGVSLDVSDVPADLPPLAGYQLLRIAQEALANVRKHSGARHARVAFDRPAPGMLRMTIADDGVGFDPASLDTSGRRSWGLATMRERAESLGGSLEVESRPGEGARVIVSVPAQPTPGEARIEAHSTAAR
jgi:signal transduction histidine kinase